MTGADIPAAESAGARIALSQREREALFWISQGLTQAQTANRMGVSPATIDTYIKRIRRKVSPGNRADLNQRDGSLHATTGQQRDSQIAGGPDRCPHA